MKKFEDYLNYEEDYQSGGKRSNRKERKAYQSRDRSKYKKSDQDQKRNQLSKKEPSLKENDKRGRVLSISPDYMTVISDHIKYDCSLKGALKKEHTKQKNLIAVGDWVHFKVINQNSGSIIHIEERSSFLGRADNLSRRKQQLIAVNIDQVFIVMSVLSPKFKPLLVDRYILSALKGNMRPIVIINKTDLLSDPPENIDQKNVDAEKLSLQEFLKAYEARDIPILEISVSNGTNLDQLKDLMQNQTSVFSGQSGVGKTSLINTILGLNLPVGDMVDKTQKGSHTTTSATLIPLENNGFCVDTPGIKSFGVYNTCSEEILLAFPDFNQFSLECKFPNCSHIHEPNCAIKAAVEKGEIHPLRYASYSTLLKEPSFKEWD